MIRGIGTDLVAVARIESLSQTNDGRFLTRWFTADELTYCQGKAHPARHLAARLAAKESVAKALRLNRDHALRWQDIEVTLDVEGAPGIAVHGGLADEVPAGCRWHVALSHTDDHATAVAVLEER